jgi:predicted transcriptional regulator
MEKKKEWQRMKVIRFGIKSLEEGFKDFKEAYYAAARRLPFEPRKGTYFTSLDAARNFLTPKRLEILHAIKEKKPQSIYELAKCTDRSFSSVSKDVEILEKHGLIKLSPIKKSPRKALRPQAPYDAINLWITI